MYSDQCLQFVLEETKGYRENLIFVTWKQIVYINVFLNSTLFLNAKEYLDIEEGGQRSCHAHFFIPGSQKVS